MGEEQDQHDEAYFSVHPPSLVVTSSRSRSPSPLPETPCPSSPASRASTSSTPQPRRRKGRRRDSNHTNIIQGNDVSKPTTYERPSAVDDLTIPSLKPKISPDRSNTSKQSKGETPFDEGCEVVPKNLNYSNNYKMKSKLMEQNNRPLSPVDSVSRREIRDDESIGKPKTSRDIAKLRESYQTTNPRHNHISESAVSDSSAPDDEGNTMVPLQKDGTNNTPMAKNRRTTRNASRHQNRAQITSPGNNINNNVSSIGAGTKSISSPNSNNAVGSFDDDDIPDDEKNAGGQIIANEEEAHPDDEMSPMKPSRSYTGSSMDLNNIIRNAMTDPSTVFDVDAGADDEKGPLAILPSRSPTLNDTVQLSPSVSNSGTGSNKSKPGSYDKESPEDELPSLSLVRKNPRSPLTASLVAEPSSNNSHGEGAGGKGSSVKMSDESKSDKSREVIAFDGGQEGLEGLYQYNLSEAALLTFKVAGKAMEDLICGPPEKPAVVASESAPKTLCTTTISKSTAARKPKSDVASCVSEDSDKTEPVSNRSNKQRVTGRDSVNALEEIEEEIGCSSEDDAKETAIPKAINFKDRRIGGTSNHGNKIAEHLDYAKDNRNKTESITKTAGGRSKVEPKFRIHDDGEKDFYTASQPPHLKNSLRIDPSTTRVISRSIAKNDVVLDQTFREENRQLSRTQKTRREVAKQGINVEALLATSKEVLEETAGRLLDIENTEDTTSAKDIAKDELNAEEKLNREECLPFILDPTLLDDERIENMNVRKDPLAVSAASSVDETGVAVSLSGSAVNNVVDEAKNETKPPKSSIKEERTHVEYPQEQQKTPANDTKSGESTPPTRQNFVEPISSDLSDASPSTESSTANTAIGASIESISKVQSKNVEEIIKPLDSSIGISKGDTMISLLSNDSSRVNTQQNGKDMVGGAVKRMRQLRKNFNSVETGDIDGICRDSPSKSPGKRRRSSCTRDVNNLQQSALKHLQNDEYGFALGLYEDIILTYSERLKKREENRSTCKTLEGEEEVDLRPNVAAVLHNIGILNLLSGEYEQALKFFKRASDARKACLGYGHSDHVTSMVKLAICNYATESFSVSRALIVEALTLSKGMTSNMSDLAQLGEMLNNLGCLSFACGQKGAAMTVLKESIEVQSVILNDSLYIGSSESRHAVCLNISVARANLGYIRLSSSDVSGSIDDFEWALSRQQMTLDDSNKTLLSTMEHLAISNLLAGNGQKATKMYGRMFQADKSDITREKVNLAKLQDKDFIMGLETFFLGEKNEQSASPESSEKRKTKKNNFNLFRKKELNSKQVKILYET